MPKGIGYGKKKVSKVKRSKPKTKKLVAKAKSAKELNGAKKFTARG